MNRRHLVTLLKLAVIAALMIFVFSTVQWDDTYIQRSGDGAESVTTGKIIGPWDRPEVTFQALAEDGTPVGEVLLLRPSEISPGFGTYLRNLDVWIFALGALCYCFSVLLSGTRWWWLLRVNDLRVRWVDAQRFTWIGLFFNNVVPGQTGGDAVKAIYVMKHCPGGRLPALMSVLVDRILGLGSLALLGAIVVLFALDKEGFSTLAGGIWTVLLAVGLIGILAFSKRVRRLIRLDDLLKRLPGKASGVLRRIDTAVHFYRGFKAGIGIWMVVGMLNHAVSVTGVMLIGEALHVGMPALEYFVLLPVINILSAVPIGPNGWGVGEVAFRYLFGEYGAIYLTEIPRAEAAITMGTRGVALSVLWRVHMTLWSMLGGLLMLFERDPVTRKDIEKEVSLDDDDTFGDVADTEDRPS